MQLSVIEKYKKNKAEVDILRNDGAMSLLLRLGRNLPINSDFEALEHPNIVLLQKAGFITVDEQTILLSEQGWDFLALLLDDPQLINVTRNSHAPENDVQSTFNHLELAENNK